MNDYDLRQLNRMENAINAFLENDVSFHSLVYTLSFLVANLEDVSDSWKSNFRDKWGQLEMINADICEEGRPLTEAEHEHALKYANVLKNLIENLIEQGISSD